MLLEEGYFLILKWERDERIIPSGDEEPALGHIKASAYFRQSTSSFPTSSTSPPLFHPQARCSELIHCTDQLDSNSSVFRVQSPHNLIRRKASIWPQMTNPYAYLSNAYYIKAICRTSQHPDIYLPCSKSPTFLHCWSRIEIHLLFRAGRTNACLFCQIISVRVERIIGRSSSLHGNLTLRHLVGCRCKLWLRGRGQRAKDKMDWMSCSSVAFASLEFRIGIEIPLLIAS